MPNTNAKPVIAVALAIATGVLIGACATQPQSAEDREQPMTVDELLASAPMPEGSANPVNCLRQAAYTDVEVVKPDLLLFRNNRDGVWLNRLRQSCVGLDMGHALAFRMRSNRLCELDTVSGVGMLGEPLSPVSIPCSLGKFEPLSPTQADLLKTGLARR